MSIRAVSSVGPLINDDGFLFKQRLKLWSWVVTTLCESVIDALSIGPF